jgi:ADP-ribose pyrophosphatase YjhB (NUDIX family)
MYSICAMMNPHSSNEKDIETFELKVSSESLSPPILHHLQPIDPKNLIHKSFEDIDTAHRNGMLHVGTWIFVVDQKLVNQPRILLLKRGPKLVTCPSSWGLVGEHAFKDEAPVETVRRGIKEELGMRALEFIDQHGSIRNITDIPVYYFRAYGKENGNRIDSQITYLYLVEIGFDSGKTKTMNHVDDLLDLDDEVADHQWISLPQLKEWNDAEKKNVSEFCHDTIVSLMNLGLERLEIMLK